MKRNLSWKSGLLFVGLSALLVIIGHGLVMRRTFHGPTEELTIRGDSFSYFQMAAGEVSNIPGRSGRYGSRILVPLLARLLPFSVTANFRIISYASLFLCYFVALLMCTRLGFGYFPSFLSLFSVYSSRWHLYNYHNPYLTDAFGLMILFVLLFSTMERSYIVFSSASVLGVLARETTILLVPLWIVTKRWRQFIGVMVAALCALVVPRWGILAVPMDIVRFAAPISQAQHFFFFLSELLLSWGFLWVLVLLGITFLPFKRFQVVGGAFVLLFLGTFVHCVFFLEPDRGDVGRLFSVLSPVVVVACAQLYSILSRRNAFFMTTFFLLSVTQLFSGIPTAITPRESWVFQGTHYHELFSKMSSGVSERLRWVLVSYGFRSLILGVGTCFSLFTAFVLRDQLVQNLREKILKVKVTIEKRNSHVKA